MVPVKKFHIYIFYKTSANTSICLCCFKYQIQKKIWLLITQLNTGKNTPIIASCIITCH